MQVAGSKPWFCRKKTTRLGLELLAGDAKRLSGTSDAPKEAQAPAAMP
jgi:hypothetical protein